MLRIIRTSFCLLLILVAANSAGEDGSSIRTGNRNNRILLAAELGKSSFKDVMAALGQARYFRYEDADAICYKSRKDSLVVVFASGIAGERTYLTDFTVAPASSLKGIRLEACTLSDQVSGDLATSSGLRLGLSVSQLENILGKPTERHGNSWVYRSLDQRKMTPEEQHYFQQAFPKSGSFDMLLLTRIKLRMLDNHVASFQVLFTVTT